MNLGIDGKVALIVGGASGFGEATARLFATEGAHVMVADVDDDRGEKVCREISQTGAQANFVHTDVLSHDDVAGMVDKTLATFGTIEMMFCSAGCRSMGRWPDITLQEWDTVMDVHLRGTFLCLQEVCRRVMIPNRYGRIVTVSSLAAHGWGDMSVYSVAKAGIAYLTKCVAKSVGQYNVRVNSISPGQILTPLTARWMDSPEAKKQAVDSSLLKRLGSPEDIANAVVFLCSDCAAHITAMDLNLSAGQVVY